MAVSARRRKGQHGQAILESALVMITTLCTILFIVDISRLLFYKQYFAERARYGARWASVNTASETNVKNVVCYNSTTGTGTGYFGLAPSNVSVTYDNVNGFVTVSISGFQTITLIPFIAGNFTIPATTVTMSQQSMGQTT